MLLLRRQGNTRKHKRVHRIYCLLKMNFVVRESSDCQCVTQLYWPEALNQSWPVDFMHDVLVCGRRFRTSNVADNFNPIEIGLNTLAEHVVRVLDRLVLNRGYPDGQLTRTCLTDAGTMNRRT